MAIDDGDDDDNRTKTSYPGPRFAPGVKRAARKKSKKRKATRAGAKRRAKKRR